MKIFYRGFFLILGSGVLLCSVAKRARAQDSIRQSLLITPEKTEFLKTSTHAEVMYFLQALQEESKCIMVYSMGKSKMRKEIPFVVLSQPMVLSPGEAKKSGKTLVYIQGNIHAGEVEGKESLLMLMRQISLGNKRYLLDSLIILMAPVYNTDANDKMAKGLRPSQEDSPPETGERESSEGYDLNRDGVKMEALETRALFESVILPWDPSVFVDLHTTNGTWHAYPLTWAPAYQSIGSSKLFRYQYRDMLPEITRQTQLKHGLQLGVYGDYDVGEGWPPKHFYTYSHKPRYLVNLFGLRNRQAILSEAFAHNRFYERINSTTSFVGEILEYVYHNGKHIQTLNGEADREAVLEVMQQAGKIKKGVRFKQVPLDTLNNFITYDYLKTTDERGNPKWIRTGKISRYNEVVYHAAFEPVLLSTFPRGYVIPREQKDAIEVLKRQGIKVELLSRNKSFRGEQFRVDSMVYNPDSFQHHKLLTLHGTFSPAWRTFRKGDYVVDMAQPLSNLIFYLLEPQSDDGLAHWNFFDRSLNQLKKAGKPCVYPVFKYYEAR